MEEPAAALKVARAFSERSLPIPLIKEVVIHPSTQVASVDSSATQKITARFMIPLEKGRTYNPLTLYAHSLDSKAKINSLRTAFGPSNIATKIASFSGTNTGTTHLVSLDDLVVNEDNYFSSDPNTSVKYYFKQVEIDFEIPTISGRLERLADLAIVACVYSSKSKPLVTGVVRRFSSKLNPQSGLEIGELLIEDILVNHSVPRENHYFILSETVAGYGDKGELWPGPVHQHGEDYMAGMEHDAATPHPKCEINSCANYKIKDLRFLDPNSSSYLSRLFVGRTGEDNLPSATSISEKPTRKYFSVPQYSRQAGGAATTFVSFDLLSYVRDNLEFSEIIPRNDMILSCASISSVKVYRSKRSQQDLSTDLTPGTGGSYNQCASPDEVLLDSFMSYFEGASPGSIGMLFSDPDVGKEAEGLYGYRIEVEVIDNSRAAIMHIIQQLTRQLGVYENFMAKFNETAAGSLGNYSYYRANIEAIKTQSNYKKLINTFLSSVRFFSVHNELGALKRNLLAIASPYSATVESMHLLKDLLGDYINTLRNLVSENVQNGERTTNIKSKIFTSRLNRVAKIDYELPKAYYNYSHRGREMGLDYFGTTYSVNTALSDAPPYSQGIGAPMVSGELMLVGPDAFIDRLNIEQNKYRVPNLNSLALNKYGFLSPLIVRTPQDSIGTTTQLNFSSSLGLLEANDVSVSSVRDFGGSVRQKKNIDYLRGNLISQQGLSIKPKRVSISELASTTPNQAMSYIDSVAYFSTGSLFINSDQREVQRLSGSTQTLISQQVNEQKELLSLPIVNYILQQKAQQYMDKVKVVNPDLLKGSYAYNQLLVNTGSLAGQNIFEKNLNWNSFVVIEYMDNNFMNPTWSVLTQATFNLAKQNNNSLLCRLRRLPTVFNVPNAFELPIYNHLFILGSSSRPFPIPVNLFDNPLETPRYVARYSQNMDEMERSDQKYIMNFADVYSEYTISASTIFPPRPGQRVRGRARQQRVRTRNTRPLPSRSNERGGY
tara:strand:+ start:1111 stop:4116 length:3006 start_codon:yes stop_codon:yes gene_type:complete